MRLTKEQIVLVRSVILNNDDLYDETREDALAALAAYERVAALLEYDCLIGPEQLRRALDGDA